MTALLTSSRQQRKRTPAVRDLARISHHLTAEARHKPAMTALRLLTVLNVLSRSGAERGSLLLLLEPKYEWLGCTRKSTPASFKKCGAERRAPCTDGLLTHFASPRGEKSGLVCILRFRYRNSGGASRWCSAHGGPDPSVRIARWLVLSAPQQAQKRANESLDPFHHHRPLPIRGCGRSVCVDTRVDAPPM